MSSASLRITALAAFATLTSALTAPAAAQDVSPNSDAGRSPAIHMLLQLIDTIAEQHIDPPSREDMMSAVLTEISDDADRSEKRQLRDELLAAESDQDRRAKFMALLHEHSAHIESSSKLVELGAEALAAILPGGLQLISAEDNRVNEQLAANRYVGIGIQLALDKAAKRPTIPKVFEGGPADTSGALDGDIILSVDGQDTAGESLADVVQRLRGPEGTTVTVELQAPDSDKIREYTMTRGVVPIASVERPIFVDDESVAGIAAARITASTVHELRKLEQQLPDSTTHIVFDLRAAFAEELHNIELLASALIDGQPYGQLRGQHDVRTFVAEPGRLFPDRTTILLVSPRTARHLWWLATAVEDTDAGITLLEQELVLQEAVPPIYHVEPVSLPPLQALRAGIPRRASAVARFATGEFLRADGRPLGTLVPELSSLFPRDSAADGTATGDDKPPVPDESEEQFVRINERVIPLAELLPLIREKFRPASQPVGAAEE